MKRYNFELARAFHKTDIGLDGIIRSLGGEPIPRHKETIVWYSDGLISSYEITGELKDGSIPNINNVIKVEIGTLVTVIGTYAFMARSNLLSVAIPNSVTSIGVNAFTGCSGLTSVTIPDNVADIHYTAFSGCPGLESFSVSNKNTIYDSRNGCNAIIKTSNNELVAGCKNTVIPNSVTSIGNWAFLSCRELTSVTIPDGVTSIGNRAFYNCLGLKSITSFRTIAPTVQSDTFGDKNDSYTGWDSRYTGKNELNVPTGATGYDSGAWLDPLQNARKCGFHIEYLD